MSFIVFEGGEGAGKSACIQKLKSLLPADTFVFTREPGGSVDAERVREIVVNTTFNPLEQMLFMEVGRAIHLREVVRPALESGKHVICDRFSASTFAYQVTASAGGNNLKELFHALEKKVVGDTQPDLWIDFVLDPQEGIKRRHNSGDELNVFDTNNLEYHTRVRKGLDEYLAGRHTQKVDASLPPDELAQNVLALIQREIE